MDTDQIVDARPLKGTTANFVSVISAIVGLLFVPALMCACGHLDGWALIATGMTATCGWGAFLCGAPTHFFFRALRIAIVVILTMTLAKNIADVLWFGHAPLLQVPAFLR